MIWQSDHALASRRAAHATGVAEPAQAGGAAPEPPGAGSPIMLLWYQGPVKSMTGYGRGGADREGCRAVVEIRSVNHRYLDIKLRGSTLDPAIEEQVLATVRDRVERGAVTVTLRVDSASSSGGVTVDVAAARQVHGELVGLARALGLPDAIDLALVCAQPGVLVPREVPSDEETVAACVRDALAPALAALVDMRAAEGAALARDLAARTAHLRELVARVGEWASSAPDDSQRRLEERLGRLLQNGKVEIDPARLAQEVAILADRHDVTEELVRLASHFDQFEAALAGDDSSIGRRLGFLVQELGREFNTVASKSQSVDIAGAIVEAKAELEKMREQVQNIE